jgi:uncharacterized protein
MLFEFPVQPKVRTLAVNQVIDLFGLDAHEPPLVVARDFQLHVNPGEIALFTGPSGSGKSTLLRNLAKQYAATYVDALILPDVALIDALPGTLEERLAHLSACGLAEPRLMLRTPQELSDGQRFRFRLAYAMTQSDTIVVDEFTALLDRPLAKVLAFNLHKQVKRLNKRLLLATTHEDIVADLSPDYHVQCPGDAEPTIHKRSAVELSGAAKKSPSMGTFGSVKVPVAIGRISHGGITGGTA